MKKFITAEEAAQYIKSGDTVFIHGGAATPAVLVKALIARKDELDRVTLISISTLKEDLFDELGPSSPFFINSLFVSKNVRRIVNSEEGDYIPIFLSQIHLLFDRKIIPIQVALIHVSPPDKHGYCSLGTSVDIVRSAIRNAERVIAQVNPKMPRTHGDGMIHVNQLDALVLVDEELPESEYHRKSDDIAQKIGQNCAELIEDRSTLQMGIGSVPNAVLACLKNHKDLGIHTEMFSDGVLPLIESGVITNKYKKNHPYKSVAGFVIGTRRLYDYVDDNPEVHLLDIAYVNYPHVIQANPRAVAINSAIEIDLTGQICADSIGTYQYSGVGGQMDFMRGAALSEGGKPIIAIPSTTKSGASKIVPFLKPGAGVVTTRAHVHYVVTEYGTAQLFGKNLRQRAHALIEIAHPEHRETLERAVFERFKKSAE